MHCALLMKGFITCKASVRIMYKMDTQYRVKVFVLSDLNVSTVDAETVQTDVIRVRGNRIALPNEVLRVPDTGKSFLL